MENKILVTYASKSGTTVEVAEAIGHALCAQGVTVDVRPIKIRKQPGWLPGRGHRQRHTHGRLAARSR